MYYLKVSNALKTLVTETADACNASTAAIMRKVALTIEREKMSFTPERGRVILRRGDNVTVTDEIPMNLYRYANTDTIKAEMTPPTVCDAQFRLAIAAACLDTMNQLHAARMRERYARMDAPATMRRFAAAEAAR